MGQYKVNSHQKPNDKHKAKPSQTADDIKRMEFEGSMTTIDQPYEELAGEITRKAPLPPSQEKKEKIEDQKQQRGDA